MSEPWHVEAGHSLRVGLAGVVLGALLLGIWAVAAPMSAAVVADGVVKPVGNRKTVQHAEGGIVAAIHVKDGDRVAAGQALITLADQRVAAGAATLGQQQVAESARAERLRAESALTPFTPSAELTRLARNARHTEPIVREQAIHSARITQLEQQSLWLREQIEQVRAEIAVDIQLIQTARVTLQLSEAELANHQRLAQEGFTSQGKLIELKRNVSDYKSRAESHAAQLAQARQKDADLNLRLSALKADFARQAADELKESTQKLAQIGQELRPALDAQARQVVVAPVSGEVVDLKVFTIGAALGPREPILDIAPGNAGLVVESRIEPANIRDVQLGSTADVMLTGYRMRVTPKVDGHVIYVGADRLTDGRNGQVYYLVQISVAPQALQAASELAGQALVLSAGMQAEVFIATRERTALEYLLDPVLDGVRRSMRER